MDMSFHFFLEFLQFLRMLTGDPAMLNIGLT